MSGPFKISALFLALSVFLVAAQSPVWAQKNKNHSSNQDSHGKKPAAQVQVGPPANEHRSHIGDWLRLYHGKSFAEQKKSLENDPDFKKLPPQRQEQLKQSLQKFNDLPPEQQQHILQRIRKFSRMTPQQRAEARALWDRMRLLPPDRRAAVRQYFHSLVQMNPQDRQKALNSEQYNAKFNPEERDIIQRGLELNDSDTVNEAPQ